MVAGTRPPSIYDIIKEDDETSTACRRTLTSFYMPRDTVKNIHITSENTSLDVIKSMLKKFKVVDNPQKFALYKCFPDPNAEGQTLLKRIADQDKPLRIALDWLDSDEKKIVLQENDTADIAWDAFALPELNNFLVILKKEEEEHINQVILKYATIRREFENVLNVKMIQAQGVVVWTFLFIITILLFVQFRSKIKSSCYFRMHFIVLSLCAHCRLEEHLLKRELFRPATLPARLTWSTELLPRWVNSCWLFFSRSPFGHKFCTLVPVITPPQREEWRACHFSNIQFICAFRNKFRFYSAWENILCRSNVVAH